MKKYYVALVKGGYNNNHKSDTLILETSKSIDYLNCEAWWYLGQRETTKKSLREKSNEFLAYVNKRENTNFKRIVVE